MSQLKVQYCCGLLKVLESCFLLLIKATTLWQLMKSIEFESFHLQDFPHTTLRDHCTALEMDFPYGWNIEQVNIEVV